MSRPILFRPSDEFVVQEQFGTRVERFNAAACNTNGRAADSESIHHPKLYSVSDQIAYLLWQRSYSCTTDFSNQSWELLSSTSYSSDYFSFSFKKLFWLTIFFLCLYSSLIKVNLLTNFLTQIHAEIRYAWAKHPLVVSYKLKSPFSGRQSTSQYNKVVYIIHTVYWLLTQINIFHIAGGVWPSRNWRR